MKHNLRYILYMSFLVCLALFLATFEGSTADTQGNSRAAVAKRGQ